MNPNSKTALALLGMTLALSACGSGSPHTSAACEAGDENCLIVGAEQVTIQDADSFQVDGLNVRLAQMDAPEAGARARCEAERELGDQAKTVIEELFASADEATFKIVERRGSIAFAAIYVSNQSVGAILSDQKLAQRWLEGDSAPRPDWCS